MTFLNPLVLFGLLAASIPVLLHLLNLRKLKTVEFPSLMFIKEIQKSRIRKIKIKQLILLLLRVLIVVFIVMAFARPTIESSLPVFETYSKTSAIILIDNTFSMDVSDEKGNRFKQAKFIAREIISQLEDGDELVIVPIAGNKDVSEYSMSSNFNNQLEMLDKMEISINKQEFPKHLKAAAELLEASKNLNKDIYLISDGQKNLYEIGEKTDTVGSSNIGVLVFNIGAESKSKLVNLSIDSLDLMTKIFESGSDVEVSAEIKNNSTEDVDGLLVNMHFNEQKVDQSTVDIDAERSMKYVFSAKQEENGLVKSFVELESDAVEQDNREYFAFMIPDRPMIAIFGSSNQYLELALGGLQQSNELKSFTNNKIQSVNLSKYDIVVMGSGKFTKSDYAKVNDYVTKGGSAIIFANQHTDKQIFDNAMSNYGFGSTTIVESSEGNEFITVDKLHPIFEGVFKGTTNSKKIVESPKIFRSYPVTSGNTIIRIEGGAFLSESVVGTGKVLYFAVSPDLEMSTFPHTGLFPAILHKSTSYVVSGNNVGTYITAGDKVNITIPKGSSITGQYKVIDPQGNESYVQAVELPDHILLSFETLDQLGVYAVYDIKNEFAASIIVNTEPSESDLSYAQDDNISDYLKSMIGADIGIEFIDSDVNIDDGLLRARTGSELWQIFILLALLCAAIEMIVARNTKAETD